MSVVKKRKFGNKHNISDVIIKSIIAETVCVCVVVPLY